MNGAERFRANVYTSRSVSPRHEMTRMGRSNLAGVGRALREVEDNARSMGKEVAFDVEELGAIDERRDLRAFNV
jgi:hypothetical protein